MSAASKTTESTQVFPSGKFEKDHELSRKPYYSEIYTVKTSIGKTLIVYATKGGVGKTYISNLIAKIIATSNKNPKCLIIEMDPQCATYQKYNCFDDYQRSTRRSQFNDILQEDATPYPQRNFKNAYHGWKTTLNNKAFKFTFDHPYIVQIDDNTFHYLPIGNAEDFNCILREIQRGSGKFIRFFKYLRNIYDYIIIDMKDISTIDYLKTFLQVNNLVNKIIVPLTCADDWAYKQALSQFIKIQEENIEKNDDCEFFLKNISFLINKYEPSQKKVVQELILNIKSSFNRYILCKESFKRKKKDDLLPHISTKFCYDTTWERKLTPLTQKKHFQIFWSYYIDKILPGLFSKELIDEIRNEYDPKKRIDAVNTKEKKFKSVRQTIKNMTQEIKQFNIQNGYNTSCILDFDYLKTDLCKYDLKQKVNGILVTTNYLEDDILLIDYLFRQYLRRKILFTLNDGGEYYAVKIFEGIQIDIHAEDNYRAIFKYKDYGHAGAGTGGEIHRVTLRKIQSKPSDLFKESYKFDPSKLKKKWTFSSESYQPKSKKRRRGSSDFTTRRGSNHSM